MLGWRRLFYINLCVGGLFILVYIFLLPLLHLQPMGTPIIKQLKQLTN
jgi:predicted MFS family arabinose efflux permease